MNVLMISRNPEASSVEESIKVYNQAGFKVTLAQSLMLALEKAKTQQYTLLVIERTAKEAYSDNDLFQIMKAVASLNPDAKVISQGWISTGLHYYISRDYSENERSDWCEFLKKIYKDMNLNHSKLN